MVDLFRQQLDELLGADRDLLPEEKKNKQKHFDDERVCKFFLCGFCPHELFVNTKSDHLGKQKQRRFDNKKINLINNV